MQALRPRTALAAALLAGCASGAPPPPPSAPPPPELRLVHIEPAVGSPVDSTTVLVATLTYDIPGFRDDMVYFVGPMFAGTEGSAFWSQGTRSMRIEGRSGAVTWRGSLREVLASPRLARPLTGHFLLTAAEDGPPPPPPPVADTLAGRQRGVARVRRVQARTRAFFHGGGGPAPMRQPAVSLAKSLEEYVTYRPRKAYAVARDTTGRWAGGYGFGFARRDSAVARALRECATRAADTGLEAPCEVVAVDDLALEPGAPVPVEPPRAVQPVRTGTALVRPRTSALPEGAVLIDSTSWDLDRDGAPETVTLHADVPTDAQGRLLRGDAHRWLLAVHDGEVTYPLVRTTTFSGEVRFSIADPTPLGRPVVEAEVLGEVRRRMAFLWDPGRGGYEGRFLTVVGPVVFRSRQVR